MPYYLSKPSMKLNFDMKNIKVDLILQIVIGLLIVVWIYYKFSNKLNFEFFNDANNRYERNRQYDSRGNVTGLGLETKSQVNYNELTPSLYDLN